MYLYIDLSYDQCYNQLFYEGAWTGGIFQGFCEDSGGKFRSGWIGCGTGFLFGPASSITGAARDSSSAAGCHVLPGNRLCTGDSKGFYWKIPDRTARRHFGGNNGTWQQGGFFYGAGNPTIFEYCFDVSSGRNGARTGVGAYRRGYGEGSERRFFRKEWWPGIGRRLLFLSVYSLCFSGADDFGVRFRDENVSG